MTCFEHQVQCLDLLHTNRYWVMEISQGSLLGTSACSQSLLFKCVVLSFGSHYIYFILWIGIPIQIMSSLDITPNTFFCYFHLVWCQGVDETVHFGDISCQGLITHSHPKFSTSPTASARSWTLFIKQLVFKCSNGQLNSGNIVIRDFTIWEQKISATKCYLLWLLHTWSLILSPTLFFLD